MTEKEKELRDRADENRIACDVYRMMMSKWEDRKALGFFHGMNFFPEAFLSDDGSAFFRFGAFCVSFLFFFFALGGVWNGGELKQRMVYILCIYARFMIPSCCKSFVYLSLALTAVSFVLAI
ncbi:hypothetical protein HDV63DRAFT_61086 [Trichoderma sp. SZMC 28014]